MGKLHYRGQIHLYGEKVKLNGRKHLANFVWGVHRSGSEDFCVYGSSDPNFSIEDVNSLDVEDFKYFVTLTFDPYKNDLMNFDKVMSKLSRWLSNQTQRRGLKYFVIFEYYPQNNQCVLLHGLFNDALDVADSCTRIVEGRSKLMLLSDIKRRGLESQIKSIVYNIPGWKFGFSTAIPLSGSRLRIASYIKKYIGFSDNPEYNPENLELTT